MTRVNLDITELRKRINVAHFDICRDLDRITGDTIVDIVLGLTSTRQEPFEYQVPSSWWQHLKASVMPSWLLKRFPVKMDTKSIDLVMLYPHLKSELPKRLMGDRVCLMVNESPRFVFDPYSAEEPLSMAMRIADKVPLFRPLERTCPMCRREISFDR